MTEVFDKAAWYLETDFPKGLPGDQAFVQTGMFVGWLATRNLLSELAEDDYPRRLKAFRAGEVSAPRMYQGMDGTFDSDMVREELLPWLLDYFNLDGGQFWKDYQETFCVGLDSKYFVLDSPENQTKMNELADRRWAEYQAKTKK